jgi:predicted deacylase
MSLSANCTFDLNIADDYKGKRTGYIQIGDSTNTSGWAHHCVPITSVKNGSGKRVLVLAGNHGDEYEGQIAALNLSRDLEVEDVRGEVLIIPVLSLLASAAGSRLWPDGTNFNRVFPGKVNGTIAEKLAYFLSQDLFPLCDAVVDMHSGGRSMYFIPSSTMVWVADEALREGMIRDTLSWKSEYHMMGGEQPSTDPYSLLPGDVVRQGKAVSTGEFGGYGITTAESMEVITSGVRSYLKDLGVYHGALDQNVGGEKPHGKILDLREDVAFVLAPTEGIYENKVDLYQHVNEGDVVGLIHNFRSADLEVVEVKARQSGMVSLIRGYPPVVTGDVVANIGVVYPDIESFSKFVSSSSSEASNR